MARLSEHLDERAEAADPVAALDAVVIGQRQALLLDIARRATRVADAWPLCREAVTGAAAALGMPFYATARYDPSRTNEVCLQLGETDGPSGILEVLSTTAAERSLAGYAFHCGRPVVVPDLDEERRFADQLLTRRSIRSAVAAPLMHDQEPLGLICLFGRHPRDFAIDEVCFFELLVQVVAGAIARARAENELLAQRMLTTQILDTTASLVVTLSPQLKIQSVNRAFEEVSGLQQNDIRDRPLSRAILNNDELVAVKTALDRARSGESRVQFESGLQGHDGRQRRVSWSYSPIVRGDGVVESLLGTGLDITEHCETLERLEKVERIARAATQRLDQLQREVAGRNSGDVQARQTSAPQQPKDSDDRRRALRVPFPRMQEVAPIIDGKLPDRKRFLRVRCHDISAGGFSFFLPAPPDFKELVVGLGDGEARKFMTAEVLRVGEADYDGRRMKLVGCRYTGRLELISNSDHGDYFVMVAK